MMNWKMIDGTDLVLGRLASTVAKMALEGQNIVIINASDVLISGNKNNIIKHYNDYKNVKTHSNPTRGPFRVGSRPDVFIRKTIKPMLPKNERGKDAFARIHVYIGSIPEYKQEKYGTTQMITLPEKVSGKNISKSVHRVADICDVVGWNKGGMN